MNNVCLVGRLTKAPQVSYTTGEKQTAVARFALAIDDGYGDSKRTNFIPVVAFGRTAENCERYLDKGRQVAVEGRIQTGSYEKDGRTVYTTDVIANRVEFIGKAERPEAEAVAPEAEAPTEGFVAMDDDIPF